MKYFQWVAVCILWANALPVIAHNPILALYELGNAHLQAGKAESNGYGDLAEIPPELVKECVEVEGDDVWGQWPCHYSKARAYFSQVLAMDREIPSDTRTSALNYLGDIYRDGLGVVIDYAQAAHYFKQALEENGGTQPYALSELGWMYLHGLGVEKNPALARKYLLQLERGVLIGLWDDGLNHLAYLYHHGHIVQKDRPRAMCYQQKYLDPISGTTDLNACAPDAVVNRVFSVKNSCYQEVEKRNYPDINTCIFERVINNASLSLDP